MASPQGSSELNGKVDSGPKNSEVWNFIFFQDKNVEELRERLNTMKKIMSEKQGHGGGGNKDWKPGLIDANFLSVAFGGALLVIITVSVYAFYQLYQAILKKFPSRHTEL